MLLLCTTIFYSTEVLAETILGEVTKSYINSNKKSVKQDELERTGAGAFSALTSLVGVSLSNGSRPSTGHVNIRGITTTSDNLSTQLVTVSVDGIGTKSDGYRQSSFLGDTSIYKRAEVEIGSGVRNIGAGIAGNVNLVTKDAVDFLTGDKKTAVETRLQYQFNNSEYLSSLTVANKFNSKLSGFVNYNKRGGDNIVVSKSYVGLSDVVNGRVKNSDPKNKAILLKLNGNTSAVDWEVSYNKSNSKKLTAQYPGVAWADKGKIRDVKNENFAGEISYKKRLKYADTVVVKFGKNSVHNKEINVTTAVDEDKRTYNTTQLDVTANLIQGKHTLSYGIQQRSRTATEFRHPYSKASFLTDVPTGFTGTNELTHKEINDKVCRNSWGRCTYKPITDEGNSGTATHHKFVQSEGNRYSLYGKQNIIGVFIEDSFALSDRNDFILGARVDRATYKNDEKQVYKTIPSKTFNAKSVVAKLVHKLSPTVILTGTVKRAEQLPTIRDAFYRAYRKSNVDGAPLKYGDRSDLKNMKLPKLDSVEFRVAYKKGALGMAMDVYNNKLKNELREGIGGTDSNRTGFELSADYVWNKWLFNANYSAVKGTFDNHKSAVLIGEQYDGVSPNTLFGQATYTPDDTKSFTFNTTYSEAGKMHYGSSDLTTTHYPGYVVHNAYYKVKPEELSQYDGLVRFGIENIADAIYFNYGSDLPSKGRNIILDITLKF